MDFQKPCFSCGALVPGSDGPTHPYIESSPGCWNVYGQVLAQEYLPGYRDPDIHQIIVDAYACQHPGKPGRRAVQSVNSHLIGLYLVFEKGLAGRQATAAIKRVVEDTQLVAGFAWLDPPSLDGTLTVSNVVTAASATERCQLVRAWGAAVWHAWKVKHVQTVAANAQRALQSG